MTLPAIIEYLMERPLAVTRLEGGTSVTLGDTTLRPTLRQTHISYLIFTPSYVYKIKKPLDLGFLDFSTLERRLEDSIAEVRFNSRFSRSIYIGVVPILFTADRYIVGDLLDIGKEGAEPLGEVPENIVEYGVKMRRLPDGACLKELIKDGGIGVEGIKRVGAMIGDLYAALPELPRGDAVLYGGVETVRKNTEENFSQIEPFVGTVISGRRLEFIRVYVERFMAENGPLFASRVEGGYIKDCHGDLHLDHIYLDQTYRGTPHRDHDRESGEELLPESIGEAPPEAVAGVIVEEKGVGEIGGINIIDCIEFNDRFRYNDTMSDMAFLSMDLDYHNRGDLAKVLEDEYFEASSMPHDTGPQGSGSHDPGLRNLLNFYKSYRAFVRGKVAAFKLVEDEVGDDERTGALLSAIRHLHLAEKYINPHMAGIDLLVIRGLTGTGKTTLAEAVSRSTGLLHLSTDVIRRTLMPLGGAAGGGYNKGIYEARYREKVYDLLIERAVEFLESGRGVIADGTFLDSTILERLIVVASRAAGGREKVSVHIIDMEAGAEVARERLDKRLSKRLREGSSISDGTFEVFLVQQKVLSERDPYGKVAGDLTVDSTQSLRDQLLGVYGLLYGL